MKDIAIFGVGGFGREVLTILNDINKISEEYNFIGWFDDGHDKNEVINGFPTLGGTKELNNWDKELSLIIAIGNPQIKNRVLSTICNPHIFYPTIIHPSVIIGDKDSVLIGKGCIICAYSIITTNVQIGNFVIINLMCTVGHDTIINDNSSFMPSVNISGEVVVGKNVYVGTGAKIINQLSIGDNTIIGAGAVVAKSLPSGCTAVGVPAKIIKIKE